MRKFITISKVILMVLGALALVAVLVRTFKDGFSPAMLVANVKQTFGFM
jgi:hypothetical protein